MNYRLFKEYYKVVNIFWAVIGVTYLVHNIDYLPFYAALTYSLVAFIPYYILSYSLVNYFQPRALNKKRMRFFAINFVFITFLMAASSVAVSYFFYYLSEEGFFPRSLIFTELSPILKEVLNLLPVYFLLNLAFCGLRLYYEHTKLQQVHLETQLKMLQAQVNPHFMFNVLNHIHILIRKDVKMAGELLEKYSEILRYQLYNAKKESVPLSLELQFIQDIIAVEKIRWRDDLQVRTFWDIEDNWKNIPPQILAVFVENAFKHVSKSSSKQGFIDIVLRQKNSILEFSIENSNWEKASEQNKDGASSGIGLKNTKDRLLILYPQRHTLIITENSDIFKVTLKIMLI